MSQGKGGSRPIRLALQKSGRLSEESQRLIADCGISINPYDRRLKAKAYNFPLEIFYLRDHDIPEYVQAGVADVGIVGENLLVEKEVSLEVLERLSFSKCRLSIAVPRDSAIEDAAGLQGLRLATSYPNTLSKFLSKEGISAEIQEIRGSRDEQFYQVYQGSNMLLYPVHQFWGMTR